MPPMKNDIMMMTKMIMMGGVRKLIIKSGRKEKRKMIVSKKFQKFVKKLVFSAFFML